jgi:hypothetical protein
MLWALVENPALQLLALENPGHSIFSVIPQRMAQFRFNYYREILSDNSQAGSAFCECAWRYMYMVPLYTSGNSRHLYLSWLYILSAIWHRAHEIPVPARYKFYPRISPMRGIVSGQRQRDLLDTLGCALSYASSKAWPRAMDMLWEISERKYEFDDMDKESKHHDKLFFVTSMEQALEGHLWPDPTLGEIERLEQELQRSTK